MIPSRAFPLLRLPLPPAALALMALAFVLPGLAGHDLWKSHDAIGLGIVYDMAKSGELIVPRVSGWLWLYDPPLYHWVALAFGSVLQFLIEFHSAARLASGAFMLAAFWLIYRAARDWVSTEDRIATASAAMLLLLGSVGLMVHAHEAVPELATLAALCGAFAALAGASVRRLRAGIVFGAALGAGLASSSWVSPAALFVAVLAAHFVHAPWRTRRAVPFLAAAALVAVVLGGLWPLALALRSPELFAQWWAGAWQPQGSTFGASLRYFINAGGWFAWPAWPLALWTLWSQRRRWREPQIFVPAAAILIMLPGLALWGQAQSVTLIPVLAPLVILAVQGVPALRRGAAAALDWFGLVTFAFFGGLVWLGYIAMMTGLPPRVAHNFAKNAPGFVAEFNPFYFLLALALTAVWVYLMFFTAYSPTRSIARWAAGIVLLWGTAASLWMPWVDHQKSYRSVALQLRSKIPVDATCIAQRGLGVPQGASLDYYADIQPRAFDFGRPRECPLLLVQGSPQHEFDAPGAGWTKLADVGRPGDKGERFRLYRSVK
jgi:4-amino-4-deoxy-L-arabinose transferase-like glycosyltransferase